MKIAFLLVGLLLLPAGVHAQTQTVTITGQKPNPPPSPRPVVIREAGDVRGDMGGTGGSNLPATPPAPSNSSDPSADNPRTCNPVVIASGEKVLEQQDFEWESPLPLTRAAYHVHLIDNQGRQARMSSETWRPLTPEDADTFNKSKSMQRACESLSEGEKFLDRVNRNVFHRGGPSQNQLLRLGGWGGRGGPRQPGD